MIKPLKKDPKITDPWKNYTAALVKWKLAFDLWQQAGNEAFDLKDWLDEEQAKADAIGEKYKMLVPAQ